MKRKDLALEPAGAADRPIIQAILTVARLPQPGFESATFFVARGPQGIEGVVAFERLGDAALLHSLAVLPGSRRRGIGRALLERAAEAAQRDGARELYAASDSAVAWLEARGFRPLGRKQAPAGLAERLASKLTLLRRDGGAEAPATARSELAPVASPWRVPFDGSFRIAAAPTAPPEEAASKKRQKQRLAELTERLADLQRMLYAQDRHAVLLVFQAMDAAGKDSTIRHVLTGVNPAGCQVHSFKKPSSLELDHDFLWRSSVRLPERGRIGVFNRSYYEEALVVRVHPGFLDSQKLPGPIDLDAIWEERFDSIRDHELHLARSGTLVLKFFLHVSRDEQRSRFLSRLDEPHKNWKFNAADVEERGHWPAYMGAYEEVLRATSRPWAPWFAIPADDKPYLRAQVAEIVVASLEGLGLDWPKVDPDEKARFEEMRGLLEAEE